MNVYLCSFKGHWLPGEGVVVAPDEPTARKLLCHAIRRTGLEPKHVKIDSQLDLTEAHAVLTNTGEH